MNEMACLIGFARDQAGAAQLHESKTLDKAATLKIEADIRCGQFSHTPCSEQFASTFVAAGSLPLLRRFPTMETKEYSPSR